jgi:hypothetical protein
VISFLSICHIDFLVENAHHLQRGLNVVYFSGGIWAVWVNRFANAGEAAVEAAGNTMEKLRQARAEVVTASRLARRFLFSSCTTSTTGVTPNLWLRNMATSSRNSRRIGFSRNSSQQLLRNRSLSSGMNRQTEDNRLVKQCRDSSRYVPLS